LAFHQEITVFDTHNFTVIIKKPQIGALTGYWQEITGFDRRDFPVVFSIYQYWGDIWFSNKISQNKGYFEPLTT